MPLLLTFSQNNGSVTMLWINGLKMTKISISFHTMLKNLMERYKDVNLSVHDDVTSEFPLQTLKGASITNIIQIFNFSLAFRSPPPRLYSFHSSTSSSFHSSFAFFPGCVYLLCRLVPTFFVGPQAMLLFVMLQLFLLRAAAFHCDVY